MSRPAYLNRGAKPISQLHNKVTQLRYLGLRRGSHAAADRRCGRGAEASGVEGPRRRRTGRIGLSSHGPASRVTLGAWPWTVALRGARARGSALARYCGTRLEHARGARGGIARRDIQAASLSRPATLVPAADRTQLSPCSKEVHAAPSGSPQPRFQDCVHNHGRAVAHARPDGALGLVKQALLATTISMPAAAHRCVQ